MNKFSIEDYINKKPKNSRLTPIRFSDSSIRANGRPRIRIECICECGKTVVVLGSNYLNGSTISCKCASIDIRSKCKYYPHIKSLHKKYVSMIHRCYNPKCENYNTYGGRGVRVCDEWINNYQAFLDWALANGWDEKLELDKDSIGNGLIYSPETCKFVTKLENANHRRSTRYVIYNRVRSSLADLCRREKLSPGYVTYRLNIGLAIETIISNFKNNK